MWGSFALYTGTVVTAAGLLLVVKPIGRLRVQTRGRALLVFGTGALAGLVALLAPVHESRANDARTRLDEFMPAWQFSEVHIRRIAAPAWRVFDAIGRVRADEILLFRTLTWIRRGGRALPPGILNAAGRESLIDIATRTTFVRLADEGPRELVIGTIILTPAGTRGGLTADLFRKPLPPGFALAAMNFLVTPNGPGASIVSTETRVVASGPSARRRFAAYWRVIYPGSAIIRRMWLRAIERRATGAGMLPSEDE